MRLQIIICFESMQCVFAMRWAQVNDGRDTVRLDRNEPSTHTHRLQLLHQWRPAGTIWARKCIQLQLLSEFSPDISIRSTLSN